MTLPNFFIIGAKKCATTTTYHLLRQHPEIFMPIPRRKEPHFFVFENEQIRFNGPKAAATTWFWRTRLTKMEDYQKLFSKVQNEKAIGEASVTYLYSKKACERIAHHIPNAKLIVLLRNPVDRAFSHYGHEIRTGLEPLLDYEKAIKAEKRRLKKNWGSIWYYKQLGLYHHQLKRYYETFDHSQIAVYLFEDLVKNPATIIKEIYTFLEVDNSFMPLIPENISKPATLPNTLKNRVVQRLLAEVPRHHKITKRFPEYLTPYQKTTPSPDFQKKLLNYFREDILKLEKLIDRDLSIWLEKEW